MLIRSGRGIAMPRSHHAKFLPLIEETIRRSSLGRILEKYERCLDGIKIPTYYDIRRDYECTLETAMNRGLFDRAEIDAINRWLTFSNVTVSSGTDGLMYQIDSDDNPPGVYALHIKGAEINGNLFDALRHSSGAKSFESAKKLMLAIFSAETPTFELGASLLLKDECIFFEDLTPLLPAERQPIWTEIARELESVLAKRGYRGTDIISSWQEHQLIGSTVSIEYSRKPFKPLGVVHSQMTPLPDCLVPLAVGDARRARELSVVTGAHPQYYGLPPGGSPLHVSFEPLNRGGNTIRDPRPVDITSLGTLLAILPFEAAIGKCLLIPDVVKSADFPNRRD